eukprot:COSAG02_NODE_580_length_20059_cov_3.703908_6_plen_55_part_00
MLIINASGTVAEQDVEPAVMLQAGADADLTAREELEQTIPRTTNVDGADRPCGA